MTTFYNVNCLIQEKNSDMHGRGGESCIYQEIEKSMTVSVVESFNTRISSVTD